MIFYFPYGVDVPYDRRPFVNWLFILICILAFCWQISLIVQYMSENSLEYDDEQVNVVNTSDSEQQDGTEAEEPGEAELFSPWVLDGWGIAGLFGHMWLHGDFFHIIGNMLFLWIFGNAICAKTGNLFFGVAYVVFGLVAGATHNIFGGGPMWGASGAINGVVGMYLILYPENDIDMFFTIFPFYFKRFSVSGYWMILMWFVFDIWGAVSGGGGVAYFAHLGGFAAGVVIAVFLLERKWITMTDYEKSLLELVGIDKSRQKTDDGYLDPNFAFMQEQAEVAAEQYPGVDVAPSVTADPVPEVATPAPVASVPAAIATGPGVEFRGDGFVRIRCQCGKKFKVPEKYAGKEGQCPQCKNIVIIPKNTGEQEGSDDKKAAVDDGYVHFSCRCGKKMKVPKQYSGKVGKCPDCQSKIRIPY